ncbi:unnamed protein product, partial [Rotaria magnacalcarata]
MNDTNSEILYPIERRPSTYSETSKHYSKAVRTFAKRLCKRNPALTPKFSAVIANTGDTIDLHGDYVLAHDFGVRDCPAATRNQTKEIVPSIPECASDDTDEQEFCENFVQR